MARSKTQQSVSLFPFLAVLICTMGALILVLLLTTRQIREQAVEAAAQSVNNADDEAAQEAVSADLPNDGPKDGPKDRPKDRPIELSNDLPNKQDPPQPVAADDVPGSPDLADSIPNTPPADTVKTASLPPKAEAEALAAEALAAEERRQQRAAEAAALMQDIDAAVAELEKVRQQIDAFSVQQAQLLAEQQREQQATADLQQQSAQVEPPPDLEELSLQLTSTKNQLALLREQQQEKAEELKRLYGKLDEASETTRVAESLLRKRESALIQLREMAEAAEQQPAVGTDATLIQFTNSSGTRQHPVIIELNATGLVFQPSGVVLRPTDLEGFTPRDSPLVAAIMAAHNAQPSRPLMEQPYALLLVRPEGSLAFYSAQRILRAASVHFGYELLESERRVAIETPAYEERTEIVAAIERSMQRRQQLYGDLVNRIDEIKRQAAAEQGRRQLHVGADGQLRESGDRNIDLLPGRFYAGGVAPPRGYQQQRDIQRQREQLGQQQPFSRDTPGTTSPTSPWEPGESTSDNVVRLPSRSATGQQSASTDQLDRLLAILESAADGNARDVTGAVGQPAAGDPATAAASPQTDATRTQDGHEHSHAQLGPASDETGPIIVNPFADGGADGTGRRGAGADVQTPVARLDTATQPGQVPAERVQWLPEGAASAPQLAGSPNRTTPSGPATPALLSPSHSANSVNSANSPTPTNTPPRDWSNSVTAPADSNSRTVAAAENNEFPSSAIPDSADSAAPGQPSSSATAQGAGGPAASSPLPDAAADALSRFMAEAEQQKAATTPHPYLVELLTGRPRERSSQRVPIEVQLHSNLLQVGNLVAVDVSDMSDERLLEVTLDAISTQLSTMPNGGQTAVPVLDFVVDQKARSRMAVLQSRLQQLDVPTRSIQQAASTPGTFVEMLKRKAALSPAASPINVPPPAPARGGIRL